MVSWSAGREIRASHGHGGVILVATSRGQWNLYHQTTKFRSRFAAVNTSLTREWQPALLLLFCSPPVLWSGLARAVYRVLGLVHLLVNRCPQWPCLQNCNKLTTGLSAVWCDITDHSHQTQLKQCIVTAHWPTNGLQRLILRIPSQQLIMFCHQARTHARTHAHTHTHIQW